jgi:hypothetical protein
MTRSVHATLTKQATELQNENSQLKEELVFLQQLFADANRQAGLAIQRVAVERERDGAYRYSLLVVRGGKPKDDFVGHLTLQVALQHEPGSEKPTTLALPEEQPAVAPALKLRSYYQRLGDLEVPGERRCAASWCGRSSPASRPRARRAASRCEEECDVETEERRPAEAH